MNRCFVISPIGPEGSAIREHADDVFECIIKPAMKECGFEPFRSDHLKEPGKITDQVIREILKDELTVAVLTGHNANVFYELALAHAAGRPVIILLEKEQSLPFDVRDLRCVYYDLKPRSVRTNVYVGQLVDQVRALEAGGWKVASVLGKASVGAGDDDSLSPPDFYRDGNVFGKPDDWLRLLNETVNIFEIMGIHLGPWRGGKGFSDLLIKKAAEGCAIRVMLMHPKNPVLPQMINEALTYFDLDDVTREIEEMAKYFDRIPAKNPNVVVRQVLRGTLHCQTTRTDGHGIYLPYLYSRRRRHCPLWKCKTGSAIYDLIAEEFDGLWRANEPDS